MGMGSRPNFLRLGRSVKRFRKPLAPQGFGANLPVAPAPARLGSGPVGCQCGRIAWGAFGKRETTVNVNGDIHIETQATECPGDCGDGRSRDSGTIGRASSRRIRISGANGIAFQCSFECVSGRRLRWASRPLASMNIRGTGTAHCYSGWKYQRDTNHRFMLIGALLSILQTKGLSAYGLGHLNTQSIKNSVTAFGDEHRTRPPKGSGKASCFAGAGR